MVMATNIDSFKMELNKLTHGRLLITINHGSYILSLMSEAVYLCTVAAEGHWQEDVVVFISCLQTSHNQLVSHFMNRMLYWTPLVWSSISYILSDFVHNRRIVEPRVRESNMEKKEIYSLHLKRLWQKSIQTTDAGYSFLGGQFHC